MIYTNVYIITNVIVKTEKCLTFAFYSEIPFRFGHKGTYLLIPNKIFLQSTKYYDSYAGLLRVAIHHDCFKIIHSIIVLDVSQL